MKARYDGDLKKMTKNSTSAIKYILITCLLLSGISNYINYFLNLEVNLEIKDFLLLIEDAGEGTYN